MLSPAAHIQNQDVTLYVSGKLDVKHSSSIQSHVQICPACKDMLVAGFIGRLAELSQKDAGNNSSERRAEKRIQSGDNGYLQTLCPLSFERPVVQIVDASTGGFGLAMDSSLAIGTIVQVCVGTAIVLGEVKSCREKDDGQFRVGIRVQNATGLKHTLS
jgi:hypothetical protein